jgi:excisionase family DNA binding protein
MTALISENRAADILAISVRKLRKMVRANEIPFVEVGDEIRFDEKALADYVASRTRGETPAEICGGSF